MSALQIVVLVLSILLFNVLVWAILLLWLKKRVKRLLVDVRDRVVSSGDSLLVEPGAGSYRGASARFGRVKGLVVLTLTDRRVLWSKLGGSIVEIPLPEIAELREDKWFLGSYNSRIHLILKLTDGTEVGLQVRDHERWKQILGDRIAKRGANG